MERSSIYIKQNGEISLLQTKKTVDWLIDNTNVSIFDPITLEGYQRKINKKHCGNIVRYLEKDFYLPTSIICASDGPYKESDTLRIVDGQHRIEALKMLKKENSTRFDEIKDLELSVVVLEQVPKAIEIDTFITINKTSRKVDTSLAYVLKNKLNVTATSNDPNVSKRDYLSVELAQRATFDSDPSSIWKDKITFEGNPRNTPQLISLNAFVKSTRSLLYALEIKGVLNLEWTSQSEIDDCNREIDIIFTSIWKNVSDKWKVLFLGDIEDRRIIQGAIGYTAINRLLATKLKEHQGPVSIDTFIEYCESWINSISISSDAWHNGGRFSGYSSETGYSIVTSELYNSME